MNAEVQVFKIIDDLVVIQGIWLRKRVKYVVQQFNQAFINYAKHLHVHFGGLHGRCQSDRWSVRWRNNACSVMKSQPQLHELEDNGGRRRVGHCLQACNGSHV